MRMFPQYSRFNTGRTAKKDGALGILFNRTCTPIIGVRCEADINHAQQKGFGNAFE